MNRAKLEELHREHNRFLKRHHMPKISLDEFVHIMHGKVTSKSGKREQYKPTTNVRYTTQKQYPSVVTTGLAVGAKKETRAYTGEQKLLGIATLHKSNMVPVFARQDAEDIAKMRRN